MQRIVEQGGDSELIIATISDFLEQPRVGAVSNHPLYCQLIERARVAMLNGPSDTFKSFLSADLGLCVSTGQDWHGHAVSSGRVLLVAAEGGPGIRKRVAAWMQEHGVSDLLDLHTASLQGLCEP